MNHRSCYFNKGYLPIGFVFSAPGKEEARTDEPVAGGTGENLEWALAHLHAAAPAIFRSLHRYDYRITNAFADPIAHGLGHKTSEAKDSQVLGSRNVARLIQDLDGCDVVILCGKKAQLLIKPIRESGMAAITACHIGNKGLNNAFKLKEPCRMSSSLARRMERVRLWAEEIVAKLRARDAA